MWIENRKKTSGSLKYCMCTRDSLSIHRYAQRFGQTRWAGWGGRAVSPQWPPAEHFPSKKQRSKALYMESQRGLRRYCVNDSSPSPSSLGLFLLLAAFRPFRVIKKRVHFFYKQVLWSLQYDIQQYHEPSFCFLGEDENLAMKSHSLHLYIRYKESG